MPHIRVFGKLLDYIIPTIPILTKLSTLHTGRGLKNGFDLASPYMRVLVIAMAISLILTIILGVIMAFKFRPQTREHFILWR